MNTYRCKISDSRGKITRVVRTGKSREMLSNQLLTEGFYPLSINEKSYSVYLKGHSLKKVFCDFTELLSTLLNSGLGIKESLDVIKTMKTNKNITKLVTTLEREIDRGTSFQKAVDRTVPGLPSLYGEMIKTGESTGNMALALKKLSEHLTRKKKMYSKLIGASIYPLMVLGVTLASLIIISILVLPEITGIFHGFETAIPPETASALASTRMVIHSFIFIILITFTLPPFVLPAVKKNPLFARALERLKLKLPFAGKFLRELALLHILFALDTLTSCGISTEEAVKEAGKGSGNIIFEEAFERIYENIVTGAKLSEAFSSESVIPGRIVRWTVAGEESGKMESVFRNLAAYYENEIDKKSSRFIGIIEPVLILFTGLIVFVIVLLIVVPLFASLGSLLG